LLCAGKLACIFSFPARPRQHAPARTCAGVTIEQVQADIQKAERVQDEGVLWQMRSMGQCSGRAAARDGPVSCTGQMT
jgi:hypothetical protein